MEIKKVVALLLIIGSIALGYFGFTKIKESSASVEVLDLKLDFSDKSEKEQGYIFLGLAVICLGGGIYLLKKNK